METSRMTSKMKSQLNKLLKDYVTKKHGSKVWDTVLDRLGPNRSFRKESNLDNFATENTIAVILNTTGVSRDTFLECLGDYHFRHLSQMENLILRNVSKDWLEFLQNLDYLQWITADEMLGPVVQSCRCESEGNQKQITLHCYSLCSGFYPMIKGILTAAINEIYSKEIQFELKSAYQEAVGPLASQVREHTVFRVSVVDPNRQSNISPPTFICQTRKYAERQILADDVISRRSQATNSPESPLSDESVKAIRQPKCKPFIPMHLDVLPVSPITFVHILPYHMLLNSSDEILQTGVTLQQQLPSAMKSGRPLLSAFFELIHPPLTELCYKNIITFINSPFVLKIKKINGQNVSENSLLLKGQMVSLQEEGLVLYLCSPLLRSFHELEMSPLSLSDIPLHDPTRDGLFETNLNSVINTRISGNESDSRSLQIRDSDTNDNDKSRDKETVKFIPVFLPKGLSNANNRKDLPTAAYNHNTTVLFCDIVNFASMTKMCTPADIVELINGLYQGFNEATDKYDTFRVESIGDAYLVISGAPTAVSDHATRIAYTSLAMLETTKHVRAPNKAGSCISVRIGIHTGGLIWGIIGEEVPRFVIMGETVMMASRMESHGTPDKIHITQQVFNDLQRSTFNFEERGFVEIKGIGILKTYFLLGQKEKSI